MATATKTVVKSGEEMAEVERAVEKAVEAAIEIRGIELTRMLVPIVGTSPLIIHRFSEKAKKQMLDAMQGRKSQKEPKNPEAEYQAALYRLKAGGCGFPAIGFKAATVGGARFFSGVTMVGLRQSLFFRGEPDVHGQMMARIEGEHEMREDVVTVGRNGTDLRYRPIFHEWSSILDVAFVASALTKDSVLSLIDAGGLGVGVGEWRPEKNGDFGTYRVDPDREIVILDAKDR